MCIFVNSDSSPNWLDCGILDIDLLLQVIDCLERLK